MTTSLNQEIFEAVVAEAKAAVQQAGKEVQRWLNAIDSAVTEIEENPFIHYDFEEQHVVVWSRSSNKTYIANGTCQCKAFYVGNPCYHRAIAILFQRYSEQVASNQ